MCLTISKIFSGFKETFPVLILVEFSHFQPSDDFTHPYLGELFQFSEKDKNNYFLCLTISKIFSGLKETLNTLDFNKCLIWSFSTFWWLYTSIGKVFQFSEKYKNNNFLCLTISKIFSGFTETFFVPWQMTNLIIFNLLMTLHNHMRNVSIFWQIQK